MSLPVRVQRMLRVDARTAFEHWTAPQHRRLWYALGADDWIVEAVTDLRLGGHYHVEWGPSRDQLYREEGEFLVVEVPTRLVYTSRRIPPVPHEDDPFETRVTVTFDEVDGGTLMTVLDEGYPDASTRDRWQERNVAAGVDAYVRTLTTTKEDHA